MQQTEHNDDVLRAIRLSFLEKDEKERDQLHDDVSHILSFVADVQAITVSSSTDSSAKKNIFRDDVITVPASSFRESMLAQAPARFKNWFLSKRIL